jgi:PAS domain S-box-containing protein
MHLHLDHHFQITEFSESEVLLKDGNGIPKTPFSIHLLKDKFKFLIIHHVSQLELSDNLSITLNQLELKSKGVNEFHKIKVALLKNTENKEYLIDISVQKNSGVDYKKYDKGAVLKVNEPNPSTSNQFELFFNRIEQVNTELDKRNKKNEELISLNKQLLLKDQLLERNKNNVEALLNNNLQAFILVDTFYSIQAFNNKAEGLFQSISQKKIEKNAFFYEFFYDNDLSTIKEDFNRINQNESNQFTVTREFLDQSTRKLKTFQVNYTAVLDKKQELSSISIGFVDITNLVDTQKELELSQNLISSVFDTTSMGILIVNENGDIVDANKSVYRNLEIPALKIKDYKIYDLFKDSVISKNFPFLISDSFDQVIQWSGKKSKSVKSFNMRAEILRNKDENNLVVLTLIDITNELLTKQRLKHITNNIPGTVFRYLLKETGEDQLLFVSDRGEELWGYPKKEILNDNQLIWDNYHPEDLEDHESSILHSQKHLTDWYHEWRYYHPEKGLRWHKGIGKPTRVTDDSVVWDSIIFDITEEKEAERESKVLKDEIDNILVQSPDIICTINLKGEFVKVSSASFQVLGYFSDELIGERFIDYVSEHFVGETLSMFQELLDGNSTWNFENEYYHKNGSTVPLIWSARWDDSNELLYCIARDGREKKEQERALQSMNERYQLATQATNEIIWEYDIISGSLYFSDNFIKKFDYKLPGTSENLKFYNSLIHPSLRSLVSSGFRKAINSKEITNWESSYKVKVKNSEYITVQDSAIIIRNDKGEAIKMVGAIRDISQLEKASQIERFEKVILSKSLQSETTIDSFANSFVKGLEKVFPNSYCSILLAKHEKLHNLSSPSLPIDYIKKINGLPIGDLIGSCGSAAYHNEIVIASDIKHDEKWADFRFAEKDYNLKSCWSSPVQNSKGEVVATIGIYKNEVYSPSEENLKLLNRFANLLGVLIEKFQYEEKIKKSNEVYELVNKATSDAIYELDIVNDHISWGEGYTNVFGYPLEDISEFKIKDWFNKVHPDDKYQTLETWEKFLNSEEIKWSLSYRYLKNNNTFADVIENGYLIRDEENNPIRMIGVLRDISEQKQLESLITRSSKLAKIGSWEIDLMNNSIYWSSMTEEIHEVDENFTPTFENTLQLFYDINYKERVSEVFREAVEHSKIIDIETQLITAKGNKKWVHLNGEVELLLGKVIKIFGSIQDIDEQKKTSLEIAEKTKFLSILSEINKQLLDYEDWNESINRIFKVVGESINVDRVYFFNYLHRNGEDILKQLFEWSSPNTTPQIDNPELQDLPVSSIPSIYKSMQQNKAYHSTISDMPEGAEKDLLLESNIKSIYNIPVLFKHKLFGLLGFDDCTKEREWTQQETSFLNTITQNISIAYEGHIAELNLIKEVEAREDILESIKDGFLSMDENWKIKYWNEEAQNITGIEKDYALGKSIWRVFPAIIDLPIKNQLKELVSSKTTGQLESKFPLIDKWFELNLYPTEEGTSIYFKDITDREKKEQELILSNKRFEKVTEATNDAIWEWDIESNTVYWGVGYEKQFGHKVGSKSLISQMRQELIHPDDRDLISKSLYIAINEPNKTSWTEEYRYKNYDESYSFVMDRGYIIRDENDKAIRMIGALTDISHRREYEESLEYLNSVLKNRADELTEMNRELERFAYIASHDLQEPLRMITGFLSQLENKYSDQLDEKANQYIFYAVDGAKRMRKIILDLLQYSKIGKIEDEESEELDLNSIINEVTTILKQSIVKSNTEINISKLPKIKGSKLSFTQIFQNLIGNAIKYRNDTIAPIIDIDYEENETEYIISVQDNGIGIDREFHDKIFVIFQRLHNKDKYSGTGVGLAIVKKVIEQMGGQIWLESNESEGTTFYFSIPKEPKSS